MTGVSFCPILKDKMITHNSRKFYHWLFWLMLVIFILLFFVGNQAQPQGGYARPTAAQAEMKTISESLTMAKTDTGYYVTLRALGDEPGKGTYYQGNVLHYKIQSEPIPFAINSDGSFLQTSIFPFSSWKGPYINYHNICTTGSSVQPSQYGSPLDPWGNPYKFFTVKVLTNPGLNDPVFSPFFKPTLVSYGPDGLPGNNGQTQVGTGDDIIYQF